MLMSVFVQNIVDAIIDEEADEVYFVLSWENRTLQGPR